MEASDALASPLIKDRLGPRHGHQREQQPLIRASKPTRAALLVRPWMRCIPLVFVQDVTVTCLQTF
jgi:hypothetical protein